MPEDVEGRRVERLRAIFAAGRPLSGLEVDIGDDAAVLAPALGREVLSVDAHVENVHFRRGWLTMTELGARATSAALSDLAAMGAEARAVLCSLALPPWLDDTAIEALAHGVRDAADAAGARVVGGNLTRAGELSVHTTVVGRAGARPLLRRGARPGDVVYVTGTLGAAACGLTALLSGRGDEPALQPFVARWRRPRARIVEGRRIAELASAGLDVSDGLVRDLRHLAQASGCTIRVDAAALPLEPGFAEACGTLGRDPLELALAGGEDYEIVFTAPVSRDAGKLATPIGTVLGGPPDVRVQDAAGREIVPRSGFDHFAD
ncbi:MAG: thiamine-phosphate kinase [Sandaracinaceae bacterium]